MGTYYLNTKQIYYDYPTFLKKIKILDMGTNPLLLDMVTSCLSKRIMKTNPSNETKQGVVFLQNQACNLDESAVGQKHSGRELALALLP